MKTKTYTKKDIAIKFSRKQDISIRKSQILVEDFFDIIKSMLIEDNPYTRNFGVFESKPTKAKPRARNPKTNEEIYVPAHKKTRFKPGKLLKAYLKRPI